MPPEDGPFSSAPPGSQLKNYIYERSRRRFAAGDAARDALGSTAPIQARQRAIRRFVAESFGGLPPSDTPLNARITGAVAGPGFRVEKVIFESRPRHYVTANFYLPAAAGGKPGAAVLFLCGHHPAAKQAPEYQRVCQILAHAGLAVLAQDPIGQGERLSYYDPALGRPTVPACTLDHDHAGIQCRFSGDSLARYFLHDAMRAVDYLLTRPDVDPARIGVTGNSGGGTQTSLLMLADPRIAAAAPATFITARAEYQPTGQAQDAEQIWPGFTAAGFDHEDILLAMAPKPVCVLAVTADFFPIAGTRRTVERSRRIWNRFGRPGELELVEDQAEHSYTPALARAAARFFARHFLGRDPDPAEAAFEPEPLDLPLLNCTKSGQVRAEFPDAEFVFDANWVRTNELAAARRRLPEAARRERALDWLRRQVWAGREACDANLRVSERGSSAPDAEIGFWWSQPQLANRGMLFRPVEAAPSPLAVTLKRRGRRFHGKPMPVTLALWDGGTRAVGRHAAWLRDECGRGRAVLVLDLCGMGALSPDPINAEPMDEFYGTWHKLSDDLDWLGDSLVALRTYEVVRALDVIAAWPGLEAGDCRLYAHGRAGIHGRFAAALDPRIASCVWEGGFVFADFVRTRNYDPSGIKPLILPGVLRYLDVDEL